MASADPPKQSHRAGEKRSSHTGYVSDDSDFDLSPNDGNYSSDDCLPQIDMAESETSSQSSQVVQTQPSFPPSTPTKPNLIVSEPSAEAMNSVPGLPVTPILAQASESACVISESSTVSNLRVNVNVPAGAMSVATSELSPLKVCRLDHYIMARGLTGSSYICIFNVQGFIGGGAVLGFPL